MTESTDIRVGPGISAELAEAARASILAEAIQHDQGKPITLVDHNDKTRVASNEFILV